MVSTAETGAFFRRQKRLSFANYCQLPESHNVISAYSLFVESREEDLSLLSELTVADASLIYVKENGCD